MRAVPIRNLLSSGCLSLIAFAAAADSIPKATYTNPSAEYSALAIRAGVAGEVQLKVLVGPQAGTPKKVEVTSQLGWGLDEEAVKAVSQWQFLPAYADGKPIESTVKVECHFSGTPHGNSRLGALAFDTPAGVSKPIMTSFVSPDLILEFGARPETGKVEFTVNSQGEPENFLVQKSSSPAMESAVFQALRQWRFQPAIANGEAAPIRASLTYSSR